MPSSNSYRPQNQQPKGLLQSRQEVAHATLERVRVTVQAMVKRGDARSTITVPRVANESSISLATIYRREDLFRLVQQANPEVQRRQTEIHYQQAIQQLEQELAQVREELVEARRQTQLAQLGERRPMQQQVTQLTKDNLALKRQVVQLALQLSQHICGRISDIAGE